VYIAQKNIFKIEDNINPYRNALYNFAEKKVYFFDEIKLE